MDFFNTFNGLKESLCLFETLILQRFEVQLIIP